MMLTRRKSASRGGYTTSHGVQQLCAQTTCQRSCFCKHRCTTSLSIQQHYVTGKTAKGSALPAFQPHPSALVSQLTELRKPLPSVLQIYFPSHHCFGPPCCAPTHIHGPGTPALLLRGWSSFSLASQTQLGWQNNVVCLEQLCLGDVTMRIPCWVHFCYFGGWG